MNNLRSIGIFLIASTTTLTAISQEDSSSRWDLDRCISHALENNINISQSQLEQKVSALEYTQSKFERLPSVNGSASQSLLDPTTTSFGLNANLNIFNGLSTEYNIKKQRLSLEKQATKTESVKYEITTAVIEAYLQLLYNKENIDVAEKILESSKAQLTLSQAKYKVGSISAKDASDIEAQYASNEYSLIKARNAYAQQLLTLKQLLELNPETSFDIAIPNIETATYEVPSAKEVYQTAYTVLPDIKNMQQQQAIDSVSIKLAQSAYYPSLSLSAGVGASANYFDNQSELEGNNSLRLSLSVPIFNNLQNKTNVETARINSEYNTLALESAKKNLYKEIESTCQSAQAYQTELIALEKSEKAAAVSYELAQKQFNLGATDATSLLLAETNYIQANLSKIQAKYMAILYHLLLQQYQGKPLAL